MICRGTLSVNGGNALSPSSKTVIYTGTYGSLPTPTRTGYTFSGWYTTLDGGSKVIESTEVTNASNHSIYAHWTINKYNVTVNVVNGTPATETKSVEYNKSTTFTIKANSGYRLDGATVSCTGGSYNGVGTLTVSNVTSARTCTISLEPTKKTFTATSACPDKIKGISSSVCHFLKNIDIDQRITYEGKLYKNCQINSFTITYGYSDCTKYGSVSVSEIVWTNKNGGHWSTISGSSEFGLVQCIANVTCDN